MPDAARPMYGSKVSHSESCTICNPVALVALCMLKRRALDLEIKSLADFTLTTP